MEDHRDLVIAIPISAAAIEMVERNAQRKARKRARRAIRTNTTGTRNARGTTVAPPPPPPAATGDALPLSRPRPPSTASVADTSPAIQSSTQITPTLPPEARELVDRLLALTRPYIAALASAPVHQYIDHDNPVSSQVAETDGLETAAMVAYLRVTINALENMQAGRGPQGVDALVRLINDLIATVDYYKSCLERGKGGARQDIKALKALKKEVEGSEGQGHV